MDDDLIKEIYEIMEELEKLDVRRERANFSRMSPGELTEFAKAKRAQLAQRKKFLGVK